MQEKITPRRTILYMPASNLRALEKAKNLDADGFIFDLEDAVAPQNKVLARAQAVAALKTGEYGEKELVVRVNSLETEWGYDDLTAVKEARPDAILLPKIKTSEQVRVISEIIANSIPIWCMMETPLAILNALSIVSENPNVSCLVMGTADLAVELRARPTLDRAPLQYSLSQCVMVARAKNISALDGVHLDLSDQVGFIANCNQGKEFGFDGKTLIHPSQISDCNEVYSPTEKEISNARLIVEAFELAERRGDGVTIVNGTLIENIHADMAKRVLRLAEAIGP